MVRNALELLPSLRRAVEDQDIPEDVRTRVEDLATAPGLHEIIEEISESYEGEEDRSMIKRVIEDVIVGLFEFWSFCESCMAHFGRKLALKETKIS